MNKERHGWRDSFTRMDMATACIMGSVATSVFWAVCILLGVI